MQKYIASRYAQSLYHVCAASLEKEVINFSALLRENDFLSSPRITTKLKMHVLDELKLSEKLRNLFKILLVNHRGQLCSTVLSEYIDIVKKNRKEADVSVESYIPLKGKAKEEIISALLARFPAIKKINITQKVNPSLLGGLIVRINSTMIDLSISGRLAKYKSMSRNAISEMFQ